MRKDNTDPKSDKGDGKDPEITTFLYIKTNPLDNGSTPLPSTLPFWVSPDIALNTSSGGPADIANGGVPNTVDVIVRNEGGIQVVNATLDVFLADPSTAFTPSTCDFLGTTVIPVVGAHSQQSASFAWTPTPLQVGHRCLLARTYSFISGEIVADIYNFDVVGDRHVAQRNIHVVTVPQMKEQSFQFLTTNPNSKGIRSRLLVRNVEITKDVLASLPGGDKLATTQVVPIKTHVSGLAKGRGSDLRRKFKFGLSDLNGSFKELDVSGEKGFLLEHEEAMVTRLTIENGGVAPQKGFSLVEISQTDMETGKIVGGLWILIAP